MSPRQDEDRPLVAAHPYLSAARELENPSPTADPQVVGDLDRLQIAEDVLATALEVIRDAPADSPRDPNLVERERAQEESAANHRERAVVLREAVVALGGVPSAYGLRDLPNEPDQLGALTDPRSIDAALAADAEALADLYEAAVANAHALPTIRDLLLDHLGATRQEARIHARGATA